MTRSRRLPYFIIAFVIYISINTLLSKTQSDYIRSDEEPAAFPHAKINTARSFGSSQQVLPPKVKEELSLGVQEEENSAKEVLDGDGSDRDAKQSHAEDNAANEVNSVEPELHARKDVEDEETGTQDAQESYGKLPAIQRVSSSRIHNWRNLTHLEIKSLSVVGRRNFLQENVGTPQKRNFTILTWLTGPSIERRLIKEYGPEKLDPFRFCSVKNCDITYDSSLADKADAILIHLHRTKGPSSFPNRTNFKQRWIWLTDECPYYTFMMAKDKDISHYNGYFNWSMSYRMDSDVPVPYGRTLEMTYDEASLYEKVDYFKIKSNFTAIMGSNCGGGNKRWDYVKELKKYMDLDVYGRCGTLKCPGHFTRDCDALNSYKFYLAFENANCREYITEKAWWNAIQKGAVPVVMGGKVEGYRKLLPPKSFIHIDEFQSPKHLAEYLLSLSKDSTKYMEYHAWRSRYRVVNEHGYLGAPVFHYCRICEALNYNDPAPKTYNNMEVFWNKNTDCYKHTWVDRMNNITI
ncbi:4-galactosyl-N-acetylglucosaminide 3-alpha-L-fucosyltransferase FUT5-like [Palaemon carinicauda]|uniref:4-galactosyl-N-acetylglucosaminide 3-alpha-L-fucosyltransferase FUT5-like n=1 Tax=Palaemon carinicauda TaxID=392227 RepID=UPI0035B69A03